MKNMKNMKNPVLHVFHVFQTISVHACLSDRTSASGERGSSLAVLGTGRNEREISLVDQVLKGVK